MLSPLVAAVLLLSNSVAYQSNPAFDAPVGDPSSDWLSFSGFQYLGGKPGEWSRPFDNGYDYSKLSPVAASAAALDLKVNFVVFTRSYRTGLLLDGLGTDSARGYVEKSTKDRLMFALARLSALVNAWSAGKIQLRPTVRYENDPVDVTQPSAIASDYLSTHLNGGYFDAEDGVERGPFQAVIVLVPTPVANDVVTGEVNRTPYALSSFTAMGSERGGSIFEQSLFAQIYEQLGRKLQMDGIGGLAGRKNTPAVLGLPALDRLVAINQISVLKPGLDPDPVAALAALSSGRMAGAILPDMPEGTRSAVSKPFTIEKEQDSTRGETLKISELAMFRDGGFALPKPTGGFGPTSGFKPGFSFSVKSNVHDLLAIRFVLTNGRFEEFTFGASERPETQYSVPADGAWHTVTIPVSGLAKLGDALDRIEIGVPGFLKGKSRIDMGGLRWNFTDFKFTDDAPQTSPNVIRDALLAIKAAEASGNISQLALYAGGNETLTRINAVRALGRLKLATIPPELVAATNDLDYVVAESAIKAIAAQDLPDTSAILRKTARICATDHGRSVAIRELKPNKEGALIIEFAGYTASDSRTVRTAAVTALAIFSADNAKRFRLAATIQDDPGIRLAALLNASADEEDYVRRKLLYLAVSDPSDAVRIFSTTLLLKSKDAATRAEGLKGIRDDSPWVRLKVVEAIATNVPVEEAKTALRNAVVDLNPSVRAAAATQLGMLGDVSPAEVQNLLPDDYPTVVVSLIALVEKGRLKVPSEVVTRWKMNGDPAIKRRAEAIK